MRSTVPEGAVHVAVGVVADATGRVLVARRPPHKPHGGKWEFPGGKRAPGEAPLEALTRELQEELGITVRRAYPLLTVPHDYPDQRVVLDVWRVASYSGEPEGREGQELRWSAVADLGGLDFPEANGRIVRALQLPPFYLITHGAHYGRTETLARLSRALAAGARLIYLREPQLPIAEYRSLAREAAALCRGHGAQLLVGADPDLALECGAQGVHLSSRRLLAAASRPLGGGYWVGVSCHDTEELAAAAELGADFAVLSPVLATATHPQARPLGWERFAALCAQAGLPVYALGGLTRRDLLRAQAAGGCGVAMVRGAWEELGS